MIDTGAAGWGASPGDRVTLRKLRWNDPVPRWEATVTVETVSADELVVAVPEGTAFSMSGESGWRTLEDSRYRFTREAWHHVMEFDDPAHWYCNVTTPAKLSDGVVAWHDIELDVQGFENGTWTICDIPGYVANRDRYPSTFEPRALEAVRELIDRIGRGAPPLRAASTSERYGPEEHLAWLAPGRGDAVALVGDGLGSVAEATADRILNAFGPAQVVSARSDPIALLADTTPAADGVVVVGAVAELDVLSRVATAAIAVREGRGTTHLVLATDEPLDPLAELESALANDEPAPLSMRLDRALRARRGPPRGTITAPGFVSAAWF